MQLTDIQKVITKLLDSAPEENIVADLKRLEILADYKYDEYQQFAPGRRFMESLAQWLSGYPSKKEREQAYRFVHERLVFFSRGDIFHFTKMAYRHKIRPALLEWYGTAATTPIHQWLKLSRSRTFEAVERRCLYLGLSDGAHIDDFRRLGILNNEQVHVSYQLPVARAQEMIERLGDFLKARTEQIASEGFGSTPQATFDRVFLLDDFTASGTSFIRYDRDKKKWAGKIPKFVREMNTVEANLAEGARKNKDWQERKEPSLRLLDESQVLVCLVLYIASQKAVTAIREQLKEYSEWLKTEGVTRYAFTILVVQQLDESIPIGARATDNYDAMIVAHDVDGTYDSSIAKGGPPGHQCWGFAECRLPVVLFHNTPNNSVAPLWVYRELKMPGLFPRITRHWDDE